MSEENLVEIIVQVDLKKLLIVERAKSERG